MLKEKLILGSAQDDSIFEDENPVLARMGFSFARYFFRDGLAETKSGADREASRPPAIFQQVVEEVVVDLVHLHAEGEPSRGIPVEASAEAVEAGPARLCARRGESLHDECCDRVGGVGPGYFANGAQVRTDEDCDWDVVPDRKLGPGGEGLRRRAGGHRQLIARRQQASERQIIESRLDHQLIRHGEKVSRQGVVPGDVRIVEACSHHPGEVVSNLNVKTVFVEVEVRRGEIREAAVDIEALNILLLRRNRVRGNERHQGKRNESGAARERFSEHAGLLDDRQKEPSPNHED